MIKNIRTVRRHAHGAWGAFWLGGLLSLSAIAQPSLAAVSVPGASPPRLVSESQPPRDLKWSHALDEIPLRIRLDPLSDQEIEQLTPRRKDQPLQIGFARDLPSSHRGDLAPWITWVDLADGSRVATLTIHSPDARAMRVGMRLDRLPHGVEVRYFGARPDEIFGPYRAESIDQPGRPFDGASTSQAVTSAAEEPIDWSPVIEGDTAGIEILVEAEGADHFSIEVPVIQHLVYSALDPLDKSLDGIDSSGACNIDIKCEPTDPPELSGAVAKIVFTRGSGTYLCTGTLLNDQDPATWIPYFMTANHCLSTQAVANTLNSYWLFERTSCGGEDPTEVIQFTAGADLLATQAETDFTLLRLRDSTISTLEGIYFAGWSTASLMDAAADGSVIGIHHPKGDLKKWSSGKADGFAPYLGAVNGTGSHIRVTWSAGTTEPASSGSGLFAMTGEQDQQLLLVGTLHGGYASCTNPTAPDWYGRFDLTYPWIEEWLGANDPDTTLSIIKTGEGDGSVISSPPGIDCGDTCSADFISGTSVTLNASPAEGSIFLGWGGGCAGTEPCQLTLTESVEVMAYFEDLGTPLQTGVAITDLAAESYGEAHYSVAVPSGSIGLEIVTEGGSGNLDLYVRQGARPTLDQFDCLGDAPTNDETCRFDEPIAGVYFIMLRGNPDYSGATLEARVEIQTRILRLDGDLSFGDVVVSTSAQRTLEIGNEGNVPLTVNEIHYPEGFSGDWSGGEIAPGAVMPVTVTFAPTIPQPYGGDLVVVSDATDGLDRLALSGVGIAPPSRIGLAGLNESGEIFYTTDLESWQAVPGRLEQLILADLDGDGLDDLVGLNAAGEIFHSLDLTSWQALPGILAQLLAGDLDGDGHQDLIGINAEGQIYFTTDLQTWSWIPGTLARLTVGHLDADGQADLVGLNMDGQIYVSTDRATWDRIPGTLSTLAIGDVDGDALGDLVGLDEDGAIHYSSDRATWTSISGRLAQLLLADLDDAAGLDLVGLSADGGIFYTLDRDQWTQIPGQLFQLLSADLDGDGLMDLIGLNAEGLIFSTTDLLDWQRIPGRLRQLRAGRF
ncbi:MAG: hypothetical protein EOM91_08190 [Sphingobacteriia bacterium]|nr:hypothetical protein [Sphingobacteriia bacterium]NCC40080.1 hypothetical protein [Gammaproteobacteria bacterium]